MDEVEEANIKEKLRRQATESVKGAKRVRRKASSAASVTSGVESEYAGSEMLNGTASTVVDGIEEMVAKKPRSRRKVVRRSRRRKSGDDDDDYRE